MTIDETFPDVRFPISQEAFRWLPRHPGYRYDYIDGEAHLTAVPRQYHCVLPLSHREPAADLEAGETRITFRRMVDSDWSALEPVFARAFRQSTPLGRADESSIRDAVRVALHRTRANGSGAVVQKACFIAQAALPGRSRDVIGGIIPTLLPCGDLERFDDLTWTETAPADAVQRRWGRPHLTWVFVHPAVARRGVASTLLSHTVNELYELGYRELASTFLLGNECSALWHWRNGFQLKSYVGSVVPRSP